MQLKHADRLRRDLPRVALLLSIGVIAVITLTPSGQASGGGGWACLFCSTFSLADAILNMLLFVPLGMSLRWTRLSAVQAIAVGFLSTLAIESAQLFLIPGRDASIGDLITNTAGSGLGFLLAATMRRWLWPTREQASRISLAYALLVIGIVGGTGILLKPSFTDAAYYGQWTPNLGHLEWYRGSVLDARIGPLELPSRRLEQTESVRAEWLAGSPIELRAVTGPQPPALASLFSIYDEHQREILLVGPDRDDLVFRYRTRSIAMRLHQPNLKLTGAMEPLHDGDSLSLAAWRQGQRHCVELNAELFCDLGFTAGSGWSLLLSSTSLSNGVKAILNAAWLAGLLVPLGYWSRANLGTLTGGSLVALALIALPPMTGLLPTPITEWVGAGAGIGVGLLLQAGLRRITAHHTA